MSENIYKLAKLNDLLTTSSRRRHIIVLNPGEKNDDVKDQDTNIIYDEIDWRIPDEIHAFIDELSQNDQLSNEDKILLLYEKLCRDYVYDDNILSYIKKIDDDSYVLPDWYGRDIDEKWEKNREGHNRRVCYEVSRYLAKSLRELFKDNKMFDVCIFWDKSLTHYFVGLTCDDYSITLDLDDFNSIKDLTRVKTGLTADGIVILEDKKGKINGAIDRFNEGRSKDAIKKVEHDMVYNNDNQGADPKSQKSNQMEEPDNIVFINNAIEILKSKYDIDSQGLYEYIKEIVDITLGPQARKKVWKELTGEQTRYIRCLVLKEGEQKYIIDVDQGELRRFSDDELQGENRKFIPYKELTSEELIDYRSRREGRYDGR